MLGTNLGGEHLNWLISLKRWVEFIQLIWRTKEEMAKKLPKKPKNIKNRSFSLITQRITNRIQQYY